MRGWGGRERVGENANGGKAGVIRGAHGVPLSPLLPLQGQSARGIHFREPEAVALQQQQQACRPFGVREPCGGPNLGRESAKDPSPSPSHPVGLSGTMRSISRFRFDCTSSTFPRECRTPPAGWQARWVTDDLFARSLGRFFSG